MGQAGADAKTPDCALLLELRARMRVLVDTQNAKWTYMFKKLDTLQCDVVCPSVS